MAKPQPDKCGANELLDNVQNKTEDIKSKITEQLGLGADASTIRDNLKELLSPLDQVMTEVAPKLAATPPVSLQGGIKDFISSFDAKKIATSSGKNEAAGKLALLEKDFGPKLKDKGLNLNDLIKQAGGALGQDIDVGSISAGIATDSAAAASFLSGTGEGSLTGELSSAFGISTGDASNLAGGLTGGTNPLTNFGSIGDKLGLGSGSVQENNAGLLSTVTSLTGGGLEGKATSLTALKNSATGAPLTFCEISAGQGGFTIPNIEIPADLSGSGITQEEREVRSSTGLLVISVRDEYKEITSVQGKREGSPFFTNIQGWKISPTNTGIVLLPAYKEGEKNWAEVVVKYIVELVKEKSVEITQADTNEAKEKVTPVTTNVNAFAKKTDFKLGSLFKKFDNTLIGKGSDKAESSILSLINNLPPDLKEKAEKDLAEAKVERAKLLADPLNYKPKTIPDAGGGKPKVVEVVTPEVQNKVTTETVTKPNPKTKKEETVEVKKTEKSTISIKGIAMRQVVIQEKFARPTLKSSFSRNDWKPVDDFSKLTLKHKPYTFVQIWAGSRNEKGESETKPSRLSQEWDGSIPIQTNQYSGEDSLIWKPNYVIPGKDEKYIEITGRYEKEVDDGSKYGKFVAYDLDINKYNALKIKYIKLEAIDPNFKG